MADKVFSGRAYVKRGVWFQGKPRAKGEIIVCTKADFSLLGESGRAEEFDANNPEHAEALKKAQSAEKKTGKETESEKK